MFFSEQFLSRRGPLGNIWLAAHWERRLTKGQLLKTDVGKSVEAIMGQQTAPLALRLTGQLLLGVVRIYSRKAKYLLDDCNDALLKIKVAFRSGAGDVTTEALNVPRNTITLAAALTDFDMGAGEAALDNWELPNDPTGNRATPARQGSVPRRRAPESGSSHLARAQDITLSRMHDDGGFDDAAYMTEAGIASGDFDDDGGLDLGLLGDDAPPMPRFGEEGELDDSMSIGVGRDAAGSDVGGRSVGSMLGLKDNVPRADSLGPMPDYDDGGFDDFDMGLDDAPIPPPMSVTSDAAPGGAEDSIDMTPRTAAKVAEAAERRAQEEGKTVGGAKGRRQIIDAQIQLDGKAAASQAVRTAPEGTLTAQEYLPSSRAYLRLLNMQAEPSKLLGLETELYAGPIGLASELSSLFTFDAASLRRRRIDEATEGERAAKRARREGTDDFGSEIGRRAQPGFDDPSMGGLGAGFDNTFNDDDGVDFGMMDEAPEYVPMLGEEDDAALRRSGRKSKAGAETSGLDAFEDDEEAEGRLEPLTRLSTPEANVELNDDALNFSPSSSQPLAVFDARPSDAEAASTSAAASKSGWSNNTVRALRVVRSQLAPSDEAEEAMAEEEPKQLSFQNVAVNASRRAAAGFFFELLVLGTKDCIKIEQQEAYADIQVSAKPALWTVAGGVQQEA